MVSGKNQQKKGEGHRERLRDKFLKRGIGALNDDEVLELLLTLGTPRRDCKEAARALLKRFGSLAQVLDASPDALQEVRGVGPHNSFAIGFIQSVARRYLDQRLLQRDYLRSSRDVAAFLNHQMRHLQKEVFMVLFLDSSLAILGAETLFEGTLATNVVYPRELVKMAMERHAAAIVIAHNHPSGNQTPSAADRQLTSKLFLSCQLMDIRLLDHLIIGHEDKPYSFADHGLMAEIKEQCRKIL